MEASNAGDEQAGYCKSQSFVQTRVYYVSSLGWAKDRVRRKE